MTTNQMPFFASAPSVRLAVRTCLIAIIGLLCCRGLALAEDAVATGSIVKVVKTSDGWQLTRNGEPYFIQGGGGIERLDVLDIVPTIFDLADVPQPPSFVGESLMPLVRGEDDTDRIAYSEGTLYGARKHSLRVSNFAKFFAPISRSTNSMR